MHLPADSPGQWLATHVCTHLAPEQREAAQPSSVLTDGGWLATWFSRATAAGTNRALAATSLAATIGGTIAMELGYAFAGAGAAFRPTVEGTRWVLSDGWAEGIVFAPDTPASVPAGHPWAGRPDTVVVDSPTQLCGSATEGIAALAEPFIEYLASLTRAGRPGLWHEVSDALPEVLTWGMFPLGANDVAAFEAMLAIPSAPWTRPPTLQLAVEDWGEACVKHRGGCCMEYLVRRHHEPDSKDEAALAFRQAFPSASSDRIYCDNCKFLSFDEARARQLWWRRRATRAASAG